MPIYGAPGAESFRAHVFVSAIGARGCAYAEAMRGESLPDWALPSAARSPANTAEGLVVPLPESDQRMRMRRPG